MIDVPKTGNPLLYLRFRFTKPSFSYCRGMKVFFVPDSGLQEPVRNDHGTTPEETRL